MPTLVMRPAGVLGDNSVLTYESALGPTPGAPYRVGLLSVTAASLAPTSDHGIITSVTLGATVRVEDADGRTSAHVLMWTLAGVLSIVMPSADFSTGAFAERLTDAYAFNPLTGLAWMWNDLNTLTALGAQIEYAMLGADLTQIKLHVADVWASVVYVARENDPIPTQVALSCKPRMLDLSAGDVTTSLGIKPRGTNLTAGSVVVTLTIKPRVAEVEV